MYLVYVVVAGQISNQAPGSTERDLSHRALTYLPSLALSGSCLPRPIFFPFNLKLLSRDLLNSSDSLDSGSPDGA